MFTIYTLLLNFLFSDWLITSTDLLFFLGKVVHTLHVQWHFKARLFITFYKHKFFFLFTFVQKWYKSKHLPWIWCMSNALGPVVLWNWHLKIQCVCIGFVKKFTCKQYALSVRRGKVKEPSRYLTFLPDFSSFSRFSPPFPNFPLFFPIFGNFFPVKGALSLAPPPLATLLLAKVNTYLLTFT